MTTSRQVSDRAGSVGASDHPAHRTSRSAAPGTDDEWGRMHAALTAWKATSLLQEAVRELDRALTTDDVSAHVSDRFQHAAKDARTAAAALDELDEYFHSRIPTH